MYLKDTEGKRVYVDRDGGMKLAKIRYVDFGMTSTHNMPCGVHPEKPAVLKNGNFHPSWQAQSEGWFLVCVDQTLETTSDNIRATLGNRFRAWLLTTFFRVNASERCHWYK